MRVLWAAHRDLERSDSGGAERLAMEIGRRLVRRGHSFTIATTRRPGMPRRAEKEGVEILRFGGDLACHAAWPLRLSRAAPDVVVEDLGHVVPWGTPWFSRRPGTALFHHRHARTLPQQVGRSSAALLARVERSYSRIYRRWPFVTVSTRGRVDLGELGIGSDRVTVIPPGVDTTIFRPGPRTMPAVVVYFGGLKPYKRPEAALRAFARAVHTGANATLSVVGEGPSRPTLERLAHELDLEARVTFTGRLAPEELGRLLSRARANLHASVAEGWGLSVLEAAAAGVPTAAFDVPGLEESLVTGENGLKVADGDTQALGTALARLLDEGDAWEGRARRLAERYPWDATALRWESHLARVAARDA